MNNVKKLALGLLVAAFAFSFSAFTLNKEKVGAKFYQTEEGVYVKHMVDPEGSCEGISANPCVLDYAVDPGYPDGFTIENRPVGWSAEGDDHLYILPPTLN